MYFSSSGRNHHETEGGDAHGVRQQATAQVHRGLVGNWRGLLQETAGWKEKGMHNFKNAFKREKFDFLYDTHYKTDI